MDRGAKCWVTIFLGVFSNATRGNILDSIIIIMKRKENLPASGTPKTHTYANRQYLVEYLNVWFRWTAPINQKRSIRYLFFYLSSNSFGSFLSQTSNLVHRSLHLSTWSPRLTSHDLYLRCRSLASRAKRSFHFVLRR